MKRIILIIAMLLFAFGGYFGFKFYKKHKRDNVAKSGFILIPRNADFEQVLDSIKPYLKDNESFKSIALEKNLDKNIKAGRYRIKIGSSNTKLVNMIKAGLQTEDTFRIKDFDDVYQMIGRVSRKTEKDSLDFVQAFDKHHQNPLF